MALRSFRYYTGEAFGNIMKNGYMSLYSLGTVVACLYLLGLSILFSLNLNGLAQQIQAQCEIQAFLATDLQQEQAEAILQTVNSLANVREARIETKEEAVENYKEMLGVQANAMEGLGTDFMSYSVKISMHDIQGADLLSGELAAIDGIVKINNHKELLEKISSAAYFIRMLTFYIMALLCILAIFIISNTIKLSVHARSREIHIMKYVGATDWFVRLPFMIEGIIVGIVGFAVSILLLTLSYQSIIEFVRGIADIFALISLGDVLIWLCAALLLFGVTIGAGGSLISIRRHLKV